MIKSLMIISLVAVGLFPIRWAVVVSSERRSFRVGSVVSESRGSIVFAVCSFFSSGDTDVADW